MDRVRGESLHHHQGKGFVDPVVTARHHPSYFSLYCMFKCEGFVGGAAITFFLKFLWYRLVVDQDLVAKFLFA